MSKGKIVEQVVAIIENTLQGNEQIRISHDVNLEDNLGNSRQIDVLIEYDLNDRARFKTIIECKQKGRDGVEINQMNAFKGLIDSLKDVDRGIFVSTNGFQKGAVSVAEANNIELYTLKELTSEEVREWFKSPPFIRKINKHFEVIHFRFVLEENVALSKEKVSISRNDYLEMEDGSKKTLNEVIIHLLSFTTTQFYNDLFDLHTKGELDMFELKHIRGFKFPLEGLFIRKNTEKVLINEIELELLLCVECGEGQLVIPKLYKDNDGKPLAQVIEAHIDHGGKDMKLGLVTEFINGKEDYYFYDGKKNSAKLEIDKLIDLPDKNMKTIIVKNIDMNQSPLK